MSFDPVEHERLSREVRQVIREIEASERRIAQVSTLIAHNLRETTWIPVTQAVGTNTNFVIGWDLSKGVVDSNVSWQRKGRRLK